MSDTFGYCGCGCEEYEDDGTGHCRMCGQKIAFETVEYGLDRHPPED